MESVVATSKETESTYVDEHIDTSKASLRERVQLQKAFRIQNMMTITKDDSPQKRLFPSVKAL